MEIIVNLDVMMAVRKISSKELAKAIGITEAVNTALNPQLFAAVYKISNYLAQI